MQQRLKRVGHTGGGFADRRTVYQKPDGSLVDDRGLTVEKAKPDRAERPRTRAAKAQATLTSPKSAYNVPALFLGIPAFREWEFHPVRKWRMDWAFPEAKLALEIEGGQWVNGRHNRAAGQIADLAKYSEAAILGWRIVYATPAEVKNGTALDRVRRALGE